jgi:osmotically-inducible protein OsmY
MLQTKTVTATVVAGLLLAAAPAWVSAADGKQSTTSAVKETVNDSWLTAKTKISLFADTRVSGTKVNVETQKGVVFLRGKVDNDTAKSAAEELAKGIEGVQSVKNELQVVPPSAQKMVEAKDDDITKQVKTRLARDARLKSLDVRTDNGVVTLQGKVPSIMDSARASEMAREVGGVRAVRNDVTYDNRTSMTDDAAKPTMKERLTGAKNHVLARDDASRVATTGEAHVRAAQQALKERGFDPGPIDGKYGPRTGTAVTAFQRQENLTVTGRFDSETLGKLGVGVGGAPRKTQSP